MLPKRELRGSICNFCRDALHAVQSQWVPDRRNPELRGICVNRFVHTQHSISVYAILLREFVPPIGSVQEVDVSTPSHNTHFLLLHFFYSKRKKSESALFVHVRISLILRSTHRCACYLVSLICEYQAIGADMCVTHYRARCANSLQPAIRE